MMRMPFSAPLPVPTMMATGVASPSAQGQEMTSTEMPMFRAKSNPAPSSSHTTMVTAEIAITVGTKTEATLSASLAMGALEEEASSTSRMIWARVVSSPTRVARNLRKPLLLTVAAITRSSTFFSTGMLSPVRADSSTEELPSMITPSTGMLCPGRITTMSPGTTSSTGISTSAPLRSTTALLGARSISLEMASEVRLLERASSHLPKVMRVRMVAADSK